MFHSLLVFWLMAKHKCEDLNPTGTPSPVPTAIQASSDHTLNPRCAHNQMEPLYNQYPSLIHNFAFPQFMAKHICDDLDPTDTPITGPTDIQTSRDHTLNPMCAHCWKPSSPFSNVHFRNTTKIAAQVLCS